MATEPEIIIRFEQQMPGTYVSYAVNMRQVSESMKTVWPDLRKGVPAMLRPAVDTLMFALRQGGVVKKMLKERGLPEMNKDAQDKDTEAMRCLALCIACDIYNKTFDAKGNQHAWDISRKEFADAYEGLVRRAYEYDGTVLSHAIAEAVPEGSTPEPSSTPATV